MKKFKPLLPLFIIFAVLFVSTISIPPKADAAANNSKFFNKVNSAYKKAVIYLETVNIAMPTPTGSNMPSFGFSKLGLQNLIFNVINTTYRSSISAAENGEGPNVGTSSPAYAAAAKVNATLDTFFRNTQNISVDYGTVDNYYAEALKAVYGDIKTSSLKFIGVDIHQDISYQTLLRKANVFLSRINDTQENRQRFSYLFGVNFQKDHKISSGQRDGIPVSLQTYYPVHRNTVNFYSLTYYLLHNIYYAHGKRKRTAEKILSYLIDSRYNRAEYLFYNIRVSTQDNNNSLKADVDNFLTVLKSDNNTNAIAKLTNISGNFDDPKQFITTEANATEHNNNIPTNEWDTNLNACDTEPMHTGIGPCAWIRMYTPYTTYSCPAGYSSGNSDQECVMNNTKHWVSKMGKIYDVMTFLIRVKYAFLIKDNTPWGADERYEMLKLAIQNY